MPKLWEDNFWYYFLRPYVDWCTRSSYSSLTIEGKSNIPENGAVILAPNHCNTLMDALIVLQARKKVTSFGVRADIFRKPKTAAILRWLRMVPLARERDGLQEVANNVAVFDEIVDCIDHEVPFCIFSEGTHRARRSLLPLKKGVFRLAVQAASSLGKSVYILPVGLEYQDYYHSMKKATMSYGEPIDVKEYVTSHPDAKEIELYNGMATILQKRIAGLITYFPDDENYDSAFKEWEESRKSPKQWWQWILGLALLPIFIISAVIAAPMLLTACKLVNGLKDKVWSNTVRFGIKLALLPILLIIYGVLSFIFLPWYAAVMILVALIFSQSAFYLIQNLYRHLLT